MHSLKIFVTGAFYSCYDAWRNGSVRAKQIVKLHVDMAKVLQSSKVRAEKCNKCYLIFVKMLDEAIVVVYNWCKVIWLYRGSYGIG